MAQGGDTSGVLSGETSGSRLLTAYETVGGRQRLTVKLKPNETTIVSWKKLLKDAATGNASLTSSRKPNKKPIAGPGPDQSSGSIEQPLALPPPPQPSVNTHLSPGPVQENEAKDVPPTSRLSTVIERIERLYASKASSDEEELNDIVPDDDDYDTEDSFIDDTELDEYFQVDNSAIKHDGFFINRGKLERAGEASAQQTKKRRRKDDMSVVKSSNKHLKLGKKDGKSSLQSNGKSSVIAQNVKSHTQRKKSTATRITLEPIASPSGVLIVHKKDNNQPKLALPSKDNANKSKENSDPSNDKLDDKRGSLNNFNELLGSAQQKEKSGPHERLEITVPQGNNTPHVAKVTPAKKREGSSSKSKNTMLERAIKDLEKLVSESRPASVEVQESDTNNTPQAVKRRLPPEVKQKLAKVARLAQASHGKITKELLDRLMSIVGHMIKIRSLKKNLETMVSIGLSAKQENANKIQQVKKEVAEMVRARIATNSKEVEQQVGGDDFEESKNDEKVFLKKKHGMDDALEDKICQLYDLHNEEVDDDTRPQGRKLYEEMAGLWPSGLMSSHGIKRGICRARNRRRALQSQHKDDEKTKRKAGSSASSSSKTGTGTGTGTGEEQHVVPVVQAQDKVVLASILSSASAAAADASLRMAVSLMKQEKVKGSSVSASADTKKVKRKAEDGGMTQAQGGQRKKSHKQQQQQVPVVAAVSLPETTTTTETAAPVDVALPKSNLETAAPS